MQQRGHELFVVERAVEPKGKPIGQGHVADVEARFADAGEDIRAHFGRGLGHLLVDEVGVDEGDGEALRRKLEGKLNGWIDMALERIRDENRVRLLSFVACHGGCSSNFCRERGHKSFFFFFFLRSFFRFLRISSCIAEES